MPACMTPHDHIHTLHLHYANAEPQAVGLQMEAIVSCNLHALYPADRLKFIGG
jgi:hypothetical protein